MAVIDPIPPEKASDDLRATYDSLTKRAGRVPDFHGLMAHHPAALKNFLPLYASVMNEGTLERRYKELAYLKTSHLNGCEYCTRAHTPGAKRAGVTSEQIEALTFYERSPIFDEKDKAVVTRKRILDMLATDHVMMTGYHMPFPGIGWIERSGGDYRYVPHSYQLNL